MGSLVRRVYPAHMASQVPKEILDSQAILANLGSRVPRAPWERWAFQVLLVPRAFRATQVSRVPQDLLDSLA